MASIRRMALLSALGVLSSASLTPALAQNPAYNRTLIDLSVSPSSAGAGGYEVHVEWGVRRDSSLTASLDLSTDVQVFVNGAASLSAAQLVAVSFDSPYDGCGALGCQNQWGCANLTIDGLLLLGQCLDFGGAPDDTHYCQCGASHNNNIGVIPATVGDEIMVLLRPAPGALPELPGFGDDNVGRLIIQPDGVRSYCAGDGSAAPCPCNNFADDGHGCKNSTGAGGLLSALGTVSVANDDLVFFASDLPAAQPALLFSGTNQLNGGDGLPFGDGLRCVGGTLTRIAVQSANAAGEASWGGGLAASEGYADNDIVHFQAWYRDPLLGPCGTGFNLTNALTVVFDA